MLLKEKILNLVEKDSLAYSKPNNLFLFLSNALGVKFETIKKEVHEDIDYDWLNDEE